MATRRLNASCCWSSRFRLCASCPQRSIRVSGAYNTNRKSSKRDAVEVFLEHRRDPSMMEAHFYRCGLDVRRGRLGNADS